MRWWRLLVLLAGVISLPLSAQARNAIRLASLKAQLWPEYDQRSMLVIYDLELPSDTKLPVSLSIRFPKDGNLIAVASLGANGALVNADYLGPSLIGDWQSITLQIQTATSYHVEYYEPLSISGQLRQFTYLWPGDFAVDDFSLSVRVPADTTNVTTTPNLQSTQEADATPALAGDFGALSAGFPDRAAPAEIERALDLCPAVGGWRAGQPKWVGRFDAGDIDAQVCHDSFLHDSVTRLIPQADATNRVCLRVRGESIDGDTSSEKKNPNS